MIFTIQCLISLNNQKKLTRKYSDVQSLMVDYPDAKYKTCIVNNYLLTINKNSIHNLKRS